MNKDNQKKKSNKYISVVINRLKNKYGLSTQFIHQSLRGDRVSETSEKIVAEYKILAAEVEKALNKL
jgi:hypothetical protein